MVDPRVAPVKVAMLLVLALGWAGLIFLHVHCIGAAGLFIPLVFLFLVLFFLSGRKIN